MRSLATASFSHARLGQRRRHGQAVKAMKKRGAKADLRERFGFALKSRREELGLTQEAVAEQAHIYRTYLSDAERGSRNVCLLNMERFAVALSLALSELLRCIERS